jgi:hypothetical protein
MTASLRKTRIVEIVVANLRLICASRIVCAAPATVNSRSPAVSVVCRAAVYVDGLARHKTTIATELEIGR